MERRRVNLVASWVLLSGSTAWGACDANLYIDSAEGIAGCYQESAFLGLYQTTVWTLDGLDVMEAGTAAIAAELPDGAGASNGDPIWKIGTAVANPTNTWSDGLAAGLVVESTTCKGTSAFWEMDDPTEEVQWQCDTNEDGVFTNAESDFTVTCGCPGDPVVEPTPTPSPAVTATQPTLAPAGVSGPPTSTSPAPIVESPTPHPVLIDGTPVSPPPTPAPVGLAPAALACNITFSSESLQDVAGCYVGRASADSSSRATWASSDGSASIVWKDDDENWAIVLFGVNGGPDEMRCLSNDDTQDPTEIEAAQWKCDTNHDLMFSTSERGDFGGLECTGDCTATNSAEVADNDDSSGGSGTKSTLIAGSVVGGMVLAGLLVIVLFAVKRSRTKKKAQGMEESGDASGAPTMAGTGAPGASEPPAPIPVFEPWGTRPPPKYYA